MAISRDEGATFTKLGEIIQPYVTRNSQIGAGVSMDVGGGTLVLADANGEHIANIATADPSTVYIYVFYADRDPTASTSPPCSRYSCLAVARASLSSVLTAAFAGNTAAFPTLFVKYYQGGWTQPGTSSDPNAAANSGHYTPIIATVGSFPSVIYDSVTQQYLMTYTTGNNAVAMQHGSNLLSWSGPIASGAITDGANSILYTTLVGEGSDPTTSSGHPWLFYIDATAWPNWATATLVNRQLQLSL
jgi:hypothetical protein